MKILAVTSCPSGVAHTYMSAEALKKAAKLKGYYIKVETQGQIGIENEISLEDIKESDVIILTNDIAIKNVERFNGKPIVRVSVSDAVKKAPLIIDKIEKALAERSNKK